MTIEQFYCICENAGYKTIFRLYSLYYLIYEGKYDEMTDKFRQLHVGSFHVANGYVTIHVRECRR